MSYLALARKYRPRDFESVVGQEAATTTLQNAIRKERLHHAYLFTGIRGTGKTSLARILAASLNCESGPATQPCGICGACSAIAQGQHLDVLEIDGASHTSVESVRELREQVAYLPAQGRYRIFIIDEVHMLSNAAFNALLKTLEEPPPQVLFIFATTEVHKLPLTILSRCQRFDLRRIPGPAIEAQLRRICEQEKISSDPTSLQRIAQAAEGSMRDALSLLDTAIGRCGEALEANAVQDMLGYVEIHTIRQLTESCSRGDLKTALDLAQAQYLRGEDLRQLCLQWLEYLHHMILLKTAGPEFVAGELSAEELEAMGRIAATLELSSLQILFQLVQRGAEELWRSDMPKLVFDLMLVKMVHGAPFQSLSETRAATEHPESPAAPVKIATSVKASSDVQTAPPSFNPPVELPTRERVHQALKQKAQLSALVERAQALHFSEGVLKISYPAGAFELDLLKEKQKELEQALALSFGPGLRLQIEALAASPARSETPAATELSPVLRQAIEILDAQLKEVRQYGSE